jgi:hypothetical protein
MLRLKMHISLVVVLFLTACAPATTKNLGQDRQASTNLSAASSALVSVPVPPSATNDTEATSDIVGSIISQIESQTGEEEAGITPADEVLTAAAGGAVRGDEAALKREALAQQALEAALSLLKNKAPERPLTPEPFEMPAAQNWPYFSLLLLMPPWFILIPQGVAAPPKPQERQWPRKLIL